MTRALPILWACFLLPGCIFGDCPSYEDERVELEDGTYLDPDHPDRVLEVQGGRARLTYVNDVGLERIVEFEIEATNF